MAIATYTRLYGNIHYNIPKKRGQGFLRSATGWHHLNESGRLLDELLDGKEYIDNGRGNFCDLDGCLSISVRGSFCAWPDKYDKVIEELNVILMEVFPQITGFEED